MTKINHKNLIVEIPEDMHKDLKRAALDRNISLKKYVIQVLAIELLEERNRNRG